MVVAAAKIKRLGLLGERALVSAEVTPSLVVKGMVSNRLEPLVVSESPSVRTAARVAFYGIDQERGARSPSRVADCETKPTKRVAQLELSTFEPRAEATATLLLVPLEDERVPRALECDGVDVVHALLVNIAVADEVRAHQSLWRRAVGTSQEYSSHGTKISSIAAPAAFAQCSLSGMISTRAGALAGVLVDLFVCSMRPRSKLALSAAVAAAAPDVSATRFELHLSAVDSVRAVPRAFFAALAVVFLVGTLAPRCCSVGCEAASRLDVSRSTRRRSSKFVLCSFEIP